MEEKILVFGLPLVTMLFSLACSFSCNMLSLVINISLLLAWIIFDLGSVFRITGACFVSHIFFHRNFVFVTDSKIFRILKAHGLACEISEDLYHLSKKVVANRKRLEKNRKDKDAKFRFILVESSIHRFARYY
ncbi:hypothetical protein EJD97_013432, partial [Solanum chilense]